jgi:hypothetical protein
MTSAYCRKPNAVGNWLAASQQQPYGDDSRLPDLRAGQLAAKPPLARSIIPARARLRWETLNAGSKALKTPLQPPAGGSVQAQKGPQGRIIAPLSTTENWPFGRQRRWHLQLFDPDLSPTLAQRSCQHGAHGENRVRVDWNTGSLERPGRGEGSAEKGQLMRLGGGGQKPSTPSPSSDYRYLLVL